MAQKKTSDPKTYTKPELRDKIKAKVVAGEKGGNAGQWSARKAQLVTQEYEHAGGGYKKPRNEAQKSLKKWGDEKWTTADNKPAKRNGEMDRYLPKAAWEELTPAQKKATNTKKVEASKKGQQFVANTEPAAKARKKATAKKAPAKKVIATKTTAKKAASKKSTVKRASK